LAASFCRLDTTWEYRSRVITIVEWPRASRTTFG
jgi:hypothetical protein